MNQIYMYFIRQKNLFKKNLRRAIMRYVNLSNLLALRLLAPKVEKRFPSYQTLVDAKLLLPREVSNSLNKDTKFMLLFYYLMNQILISGNFISFCLRLND